MATFDDLKPAISDQEDYNMNHKQEIVIKNV